MREIEKIDQEKSVFRLSAKYDFFRMAEGKGFVPLNAFISIVFKSI